MSDQPCRIVIIEDSPEDREFYRRSIARNHEEDYVFWETDSVEEGLRLCQELNPDCVLLDYQLSDADGLEFLDRFPAAVAGAPIPIVMLTGHGNEAVAVQAMKKGVQDYLVKGLGAGALGQVVRAAIDKEILRRKLEAQRLDLEQLAAERLSLIAELERHAAALTEKNRGKDEFLAMLAHELRNPLAAISNSAMLLTRTRVKEDIDFSASTILRQTKHLVRLIDDLLDVSRISLGKIELRRDVIDATPVLESAVETVKALAEERKQTLHVTLDPGNLWVHADATRLEQIVVNLLTNAIKYSDKKGQVWLTANSEGAHITISLKDTGIGMPPEKVPAMFELFAQGDRSSARSEGGLGIGLTVAKKLVEMHNGSIAAKSEGLGKGSEFFIRLPAAERPASVAPSPNEPQIALKKTRILVVEDNIDTATSTALLLRLSGHEVAVAHNGLEAVAAALVRPPDLILLDLGLPETDGYAVARRIRQEKSCTNTVIVATSGYGQDEDRRRTREAGFDHHLVKPIDYDALASILAKIAAH